MSDLPSKRNFFLFVFDIREKNGYLLTLVCYNFSSLCCALSMSQMSFRASWVTSNLGYMVMYAPKVLVGLFFLFSDICQVNKIDLKQETPVDHGEITCFCICSGSQANFGNNKSCIWVDVLDGGGSSLLAVFAPFFEDPSIKKVKYFSFITCICLYSLQ